MSKITKLAALAALATLVSAPAFALDADTAAATINSGRYVPELNLTIASGGAYASVARAPRAQSWQRVQGEHNAVVDFQATGRN